VEGIMPVTKSRNAERLTTAEVSAIHAKAVELGKHVLTMTTEAGSGHPSTALALAHIVVELMYRRMKYSPRDPWNPASDRLVLSMGHGVPIIYAAYADLGGAVGTDPKRPHFLKVECLAKLRELGSVLDGHPNPAEGFPFFDAATGSLGMGLSVAAGLALAARLDRIDKRVFVLIGDGESREGQIWEAADFIVDHELSNICAVFSCNGHGQAAAVSPQQSAESIAAKAAAFGWNVVEADGHDPASLTAAFDTFERANRPTAVIARTVKGWGVPLMHGKNYHGKPLTRAELQTALTELDETARQLSAGNETEVGGPPLPHQVKVRPESFPTIAIAAVDEGLSRVGYAEALANKKLATRVAYGAALVALGDVDERIVALDGDVGNSTFANLFEKRHPDRFFECKIAEQNMVSTAVGLAAAGKIPFASSFSKFIARATDQIDLAAISRANVKIMGSHSGVSLGADGPSQMSLADMAYFRSMTRCDNGRGQPLCRIFHPADPVAAYRLTELAANVAGLCFLRTHREPAAFLYTLDESFDTSGCKQLRTGDRLTLVSTGYMLHTVLEAAKMLAAENHACNVFDVFAFPADLSSILASARKANSVIVTVEDNFPGGLHAEVAEAAAGCGDLRVQGLTVTRMPKSAKTAAQVFDYVGVGLDQILEMARRVS
jgi:transketolase